MEINKSGGLLVGATDKNGGEGIRVVSPSGDFIRMGGGESVMTEEATKKHCELLSEINQDGGGVALPCGIKNIANTTESKMEVGDIIKTNQDNNLQELIGSVSKYGWTAKTIEEGKTYELINRNNKPVADIKIKGEKYTIYDKVGTKLLTGRGELGRSAKRVATEYFYANPTNYNGGVIDYPEEFGKIKPYLKAGQNNFDENGLLKEEFIKKWAKYVADRATITFLAEHYGEDFSKLKPFHIDNLRSAYERETVAELMRKEQAINEQNEAYVKEAEVEDLLSYLDEERDGRSDEEIRKEAIKNLNTYNEQGRWIYSYESGGSVPKSAIKEGTKVELEHRDTIEKIKNNPNISVEKSAELIARDHLNESKDYYKKLKIMESNLSHGGKISDEQAEMIWLLKTEGPRSFNDSINESIANDLVNRGIIEKNGNTYTLTKTGQMEQMNNGGRTGQYYDILGGMKPIGGEIRVVPKRAYYMGASSSPEAICVHNVDDKWITYSRYPHYKTLKIEKPIGESLIAQGSRTFIKQWTQWGEKYGLSDWQKERIASLKDNFAGGLGKEVNCEDFKRTKVTIKYKDFGKDAWSEFEKMYPHSVSSMDEANKELHLYESYGSGKKMAKELKNNPNFKVLKIEEEQEVGEVGKLLYEQGKKMEVGGNIPEESSTTMHNIVPMAEPQTNDTQTCKCKTMEYHEKLTACQKTKLGDKYLGEGTTVKDTKTGLVSDIKSIEHRGFKLLPQSSFDHAPRQEFFVPFEEFVEKFEANLIDVSGYQHTDEDHKLMHFVIKDIIACNIIKELESGYLEEVFEASMSRGGKVGEKNFYVSVNYQTTSGNPSTKGYSIFAEDEDKAIAKAISMTKERHNFMKLEGADATEQNATGGYIGSVKANKQGLVKEIRDINGKMMREVHVGDKTYKRNASNSTYYSIDQHGLLYKTDVSQISMRYGGIVGVEETPNYFRVDISSPRKVSTCRTPKWASHAAESVKKGAKVVTCKKYKDWFISSVLVPKDGITEGGAKEIASEIKDKIQSKKMENGGVIYETGSTSDKVNNLILFADSTKNLAQMRDAVYMSIEGRIENGGKPTIEDIANRFNTFLIKSAAQYIREMGNTKEARGSVGLSEKEQKEFKMLYALEFPNWLREKYGKNVSTKVEEHVSGLYGTSFANGGSIPEVDYDKVRAIKYWGDLKQKQRLLFLVDHADEYFNKPLSELVGTKEFADYKKLASSHWTALPSGVHGSIENHVIMGTYCTGGMMATGGRLGKAKYKKGDIVMVAPDNDNEGYDKFRNRPLRIVHVARNEEQHPGYDSSMEGMGLYDFVDNETGEPIGSSLYDYELKYYKSSGGSMENGGEVEMNGYTSTNPDIEQYLKDDVDATTKGLLVLIECSEDESEKENLRKRLSESN